MEDDPLLEMPTKTDRDAISGVIGASIVGYQRAAWGFSGATWVLTDKSGRRLVAQRLRGPTMAGRIQSAATTLRRHSVPAPTLRHWAEIDGATWAFYDFVDGIPGPELIDSSEGTALAERMGALALDLSAIDPDEVRAETAWASPETLLEMAASWVRSIDDSAVARTVLVAAEQIARAYPFLNASHGDFAPANVLIGRAGQVASLLDLGDFAARPREVDLAWWCLIVRHHHQAVADRLLPRFLETAGVSVGPTTGPSLAGYATARAAQRHAEADAASATHAMAILSTAVDWLNRSRRAAAST